MPDEAEKPADPTALKTFPWTKSRDGLYETYSNYIHQSWSLYDVRILFGQLRSELGDSDDFRVEERAAVTLSWEQTKNLAKALAAVVESYEETNGEITMPKLPPRPISRKDAPPNPGQ